MKPTPNQNPAIEQLIQNISANHGVPAPARTEGRAEGRAALRKALRRDEEETLAEQGTAQDAAQHAGAEGLEAAAGNSGPLQLAQADTGKAPQAAGPAASAGADTAPAGAASSGAAPAGAAAAPAGAGAAAASAGLGAGGLALGGLAVAGLAAAGGGGGGSSSGGTAAAAPAATVVTGSITAGPVIVGNGLTVKVYDLAGNELGSAAVGPDGRFSVNIGAYSGGIVAKVIDANGGNDFHDEATGPKDLNATLMAVDVVAAAGGSVSLHINPATTVAAVRAGLAAATGAGAITGDTAAQKIAAIQAANTAVAAAIGLPGSLTGTAVVATVKADGSDNAANANKLGVFLAAMSGIDKSNAGDMVVAINNVATGINGSGSSATLSAATESALITGATNANLSAAAYTASLAPTAAAAAAALGATLDAAKVAALTPAVAANLSAAQIQSIAIANVGAIPLPALGAIVPATLAAGLDAAKIAALGNAQLAALTSAQADAIATAGGFANLQPAQVAQLGAATIDSVPLAVLTGLSGTQLAALSAAQRDALTAAQVGSLDTNQLASLAPVLTAGMAAKLTGTRLQAVADVSVIPAAALGAVSGEALAALGVDQLGNLGTAQLQALSAAQVVALASAGKLAALSDIAALGDKVAGLGNDALGNLDAGQLAGLSQAQIGAIAAAGKLAAITDVASLGDDITALSAAQLATLSNVQLAALSAAQITALGNAGRLGSLAVNLLANPVVNQIAALGDDIAGLSASALAAFTPAQLEGLSATQIGLLAGATPSALTSLNGTQIAALGTNITGLSAAQVNALSDAQLAGISSAQADALAAAGDFSALTAAKIMQLGGAAIDAVPTSLITQLTASQLNSLSDTQLLGLTRAQITALANADRLTALTAGKVAAIGNDIDGLSAAQTAALSDAQLGGLSKAQVAALAAVGDLAQLTGDKLRALGGNISGVSAAQAATLNNSQLADLNATQLGALAADGDLANLTPAQIAALGTDITCLTPAQLAALSAEQLGGIDATQAEALAVAGDLSGLSAVQLRALSAPALAEVPTDLLVNLGAEVANLTLQQAQALTAAQLNALNTAGLLDDITQPLSSTQVSSASPAGLGLAAVDNAAELALFNSALQAASGSTALDLAALATGAAAVVNAVTGGPLSVANLQALGLTGVNGGNLEAIRSKIDATSSSSDASLVDSLNELRAIVTNAGGALADGYLNAAEAAGDLAVAVALPAGAQLGQTLTLTLPGTGGGAEQTVTRSVDQPSLDAGFALVTLSAAQLAAAGEGSKAITASINGGSPFAVEGFVLDTAAPEVTGRTPLDNSSIRTDANLELQFDAPIRKGSGNIRLVNDTTGATTTIAVGSAQVSVSGNILTIDPTADLTAGHNYHIEIDNGAVTNLAGNPWAGIANATAWNLQASDLASTLNAIATDNAVNAAEGAAPITIGGTVSGTGAAAAAVADLLADDFTVNLVPRGGGSAVPATLASYDADTGAWSSTVAAGALADGTVYDVALAISGGSGAAAGMVVNVFGVVRTDLSAPGAPAITSVTDDVGSLQATVADGGDSDDTAPVVRISLAGSNAAAGDSVQLYNGTAPGATALGSAQTLNALNIANGHVDVALSGLAHGTSYTLAARVTDAAGNTGAASAAHVLNIDTAAPTQTVFDVALSADTAGLHGSTIDRNTSSTAVQTVSATLSAALADGERLFGSVNGGSSWTDITDKLTDTAISWDGVTLLPGSNTLAFRVVDRAGNLGPSSTAAYVLDTTAPSFTSAATASVAENTTTTVYDAQTSEGDTGMQYTLSGTDAARFNIDAATGAVTFKAAPNFEAPADADANNVYDFTVRATDLAGNFTDRAVALTVTDVNPTSAQLFNLWQSDGAGGSGSATTTGALQALSAEIANQRDVTNAAGTANGNAPLAQYINRVTGTDVVSDAEFDAGFTITGKAAAGAQDNIRFYLDNNRTNSVDEIGTQLTNNTPGVSWTYDNATGDYTISFAANSTELLQATHNDRGSGVHKLSVDTSGNGMLDAGEASRLFLVASGTAQTSHTGLISENYSVQDRPSGNVFVYYYGDPDGTGIGLWTLLDNGDTSTTYSLNGTDRDAQTEVSGDWDYYNATGIASGTQATTANTALGFVTAIAAQVWEFQMSAPSTSSMNWSAGNTFAADHSARNSNTSRLPSLEEMLALYAANFGAASTVGALQPMSNTTSTNGAISGEDNRPGGWADGIWTAAPTPSGHARVSLTLGVALDRPDAPPHSSLVSAVL